MKIRDVVNFLESIAHPSLQESYDNSRLLVGAPDAQVSGILCTLDATEEIVEEAIERNCELIVAHHPILFSGVKSLTGKNYVERTVIKAIQNHIGIYAIHTNLDNIFLNGVNQKIAHVLGLGNLSVLRGKEGAFKRCELKWDESIKTFEVEFDQLDLSTLKVTGKDDDSFIIDFMIPAHCTGVLSDRLNKERRVLWHRFFETDYKDTTIGAGVTGELDSPMDIELFFDMVKEKLRVPVIKHTKKIRKQVRKIALCGGAGGFLLKDAIRQGADVFLTADYKYHEFFDAEDEIVILDAGHYETEQFTRDLLTDVLSRNGFNAKKSLKNTNPVFYY